MLQKLREFITVSAGQPELNRATYDALRKFVPLMYLIVIISVGALTWTHWDVAPRYVTLYTPFFFFLIAIYRSVQFAILPTHSLSDRQVEQILNKTIMFGIPFGAAFVAWEFLLLQYSNNELIGPLLFFTGVSMMTMSFCMSYLKPSAIFLTLMLFPSNAVFMFRLDEQLSTIVGINLLVVGGALLYLIDKQNGDFVKLVEQRSLHKEQRSKLQQLNVDNLQLANTDALTGLPNRRSFFQILEQTIASSTHSGDEFVVVLLDLDGFKPVNDIFGHPAGDALLKAVSERLRSKLKGDAFLSRLGGDEFGIILKQHNSDDEVLSTCRTLAAALRIPFRLQEGTANIAGTIGISRFPHSGVSSVQLFDRADYALCYSKQHSKGEPVFFSAEHERVIREYATLEQRLREADLEEELYVVFQPIMNTQKECVESFEALARWKSPVMGDVSPDEFIRSAEQTGLIAKMSVVLLRKALKAASAWPEDVKLSFNLSAVNLSSQSSVRDLIRQINASGFSANRLIFEITESAVMRDFDRVTTTLELIRNTGAKVALDDFGTGFSSLSYIQKLPLDRIKVDRSFINEIEHDIGTRRIVESIAVLCRNLDLGCVVEGVETSRQMDLIHRMGLTNVQGYFFSKPLLPIDAQAYVESHNCNDEIAWLSA